MADLDQVGHRLAPDTLGRRVRGEQLGVIGLDAAQLVEQGVVDVAADLGVVEDVVAVAVVLEQPAQLAGARRRIGRAGSGLCRRAHGSATPSPAGAMGSPTSSAAGATSRARS